MPIISSELRLYASLNMPEDNIAPSGGGIDTTTKIEFTDIAATDTIEVVSSSASDTTQTITVVGRDSSGTIVTVGPTILTGTTPVLVGTQTLERILKATLSASAVGTVTLRRTTGSTTIATFEPAGGPIPSSILQIKRMFYDVASLTTAQDFYEKIFIRQGNATLTLNSSIIQLVSEIPIGNSSKNIFIALAFTKLDTISIPNRLTTPSSTILSNAAGSNTGGTFVDDGINLTVPSATPGQMIPNDTIGIWVDLRLGASASPVKGTATVRLSGV